MKNSILVMAAHPDDEALGCGGTLLKYKKKGYSLNFVFFTDGESSRETKHLSSRNNSLVQSMKFLGADFYKTFNYSDNKMDERPLLDYIKPVEDICLNINPSIVFTHSSKDLNVDHKMVNQISQIIFRPTSKIDLRKMYAFRILSSTDWDFSLERFFPNHFEDITEFIEPKKKLLNFYRKELQSNPDCRSLENVINSDKVMGNFVGVNYAECFEIIRSVNK